MKGRKIMTKRFGFTLAEVLITLGIIGVVAAMTIPTLMNQTGQAEFKTGLKKVISTLNQAITMNVALNSTDFGNLGSGAISSSNSIANMFYSRMNVIRTGLATTDVGVGNATNPFAGASNYTFYLNDGMAISFDTSKGGCTTAAPCKMVVDVNGTKNPNKLSTAINSSSTMSDEFVLKLYGQQVMPNDQYARYIMYDNTAAN